MNDFFEKYGVLVQIGGPIALMVGLIIWALVRPLPKRD
jgi:hypothetical protein